MNGCLYWIKGLCLDHTSCADILKWLEAEGAAVSDTLLPDGMISVRRQDCQIDGPGQFQYEMVAPDVVLLSDQHPDFEKIRELIPQGVPIILMTGSAVFSPEKLYVLLCQPYSCFVIGTPTKRMVVDAVLQAVGSAEPVPA